MDNFSSSYMTPPSGGLEDEKSTIAFLTAALAERDMTIRERERDIVDRDALIKLREQTIHERELVVVEREQEIQRLTSLIASLSTHPVQNAVTSSVQAGELQSAPEEISAPPLKRLAAEDFVNKVQPRTTLKLDDNARKVFADWKASSHRFSGLDGGQSLIEPYVIGRYLEGSFTKLLITTREGQDWYDRIIGTELNHIAALAALPPGMTIFDCGANNGVNSIAYSRLAGKQGRVVAFDPFPLNAAIIRANAALNECHNIDVLEVGLSNISTTTTTSVREQAIIALDHSAPDAISIKLERLDSFAHMRPDYLKIDIEGAEVDALEGAQEIISQKPVIYVEVHPTFLPRFNKTAMDIFKYVDLEKFSAHLIYPNMPLYFQYEGEFELTGHFAMVLVPKERPAFSRFE